MFERDEFAAPNLWPALADLMTNFVVILVFVLAVALSRGLGSDEIRRLSGILAVREEEIAKKDVQIVELSSRLNRALADVAAELNKAQSPFFAALKEALGDNPDFMLEGDRFSLPAEILFAPDSATITARGRAELAHVARAVGSAAAKLPRDKSWILRVDGHADTNRPKRYATNWELSSVRAVAVVRYLAAQGIPADRLAASGFGDAHPASIELPKNRRIEFKLTER